MEGKEVQINSKKQAQKFLNRIEENKNPADRLVSYLIFLDLYDPKKEKYSECLKRIQKEYRSILSQNNVDDWNDVPELHTIDADLKRSINWFKTISESVNITNLNFQHVMFIIKQIIIMLYKHDNYLVYYQGYDRYVFIMYLLSLQSQFQEPFLIDSITFMLSRQIIKHIGIPDIIERIRLSTDPLFPKIDKKLPRILSDKYPKFKEAKSFEYAVKWRFLLFSEDHEINDTFLIWDAAIARLENFDKFFIDLTFAHLAQINLDSDVSTIELIQNNKKWDTVELVKAAVRKFDSRERKSKAVNGVLLSALFLVSAVIYALLIMRRFQ